ncbi:MAG: LUD domain-containing protein, partial [Clostridia bacterium]|nr:LUD domain-containing protein [Clostridia bacterium]
MNIDAVLCALERNNMHSTFVKTVEEAEKCIKDLLPEGCTVSHGGSITLMQ